MSFNGREIAKETWGRDKRKRTLNLKICQKVTTKKIVEVLKMSLLRVLQSHPTL